MKLTKDDLKGIVKECLVEILSEGIGSTQLNETRTVSQMRSTPPRPVQSISGRSVAQQQQAPRQSIHDKISFTPTRDQIQKASNATKKIN
ncbi:hypothetical protein NPN14_23755, partial [Vibrio parahaemolyticus]|uniref:hypothetical protein n=1 Tax=Vibrio parahaemolyticus TaxID=670 RepID=UPI0021130980